MFPKITEINAFPLKPNMLNFEHMEHTVAKNGLFLTQRTSRAFYISQSDLRCSVLKVKGREGIKIMEFHLMITIKTQFNNTNCSKNIQDTGLQPFD